jgi:hypothetical protein
MMLSKKKTEGFTCTTIFTSEQKCKRTKSKPQMLVTDDASDMRTHIPEVPLSSNRHILAKYQGSVKSTFALYSNTQYGLICCYLPVK